MTGRPLAALPQLAGRSDTEIFFESLYLNDVPTGMDDVAAWQKLVDHCGKTKVVLSWHHDDADKIQEMMRASFAGYIARDASPVEYVYALKQAAKGKEFYCSQTQKLRGSTNEIDAFVKSLDDKWLRILYCICMGYSNKETVMATGLKESTVKSYRKKLKSITGVRSVAGLEKLLSEELRMRS